LKFSNRVRHSLLECDLRLNKFADRMASTHDTPCSNHGPARNVPLSVQPCDRTSAQEPLSPTRADAYVMGWTFAGLMTFAGLFKLIGVAAIGVSAVLAALCIWKLTRAARRLPTRVWRYCWVVLFVTGIGLAVFEGQMMVAATPILGPDGQLH
jgi:hypothetical protein